MIAFGFGPTFGPTLVVVRLVVVATVAAIGGSTTRAFFAVEEEASSVLGDFIDGLAGVRLFFRFLLLPSSPSKSRMRRMKLLTDFALVGFPWLVVLSHDFSLCDMKEEMAFL